MAPRRSEPHNAPEGRELILREATRLFLQAGFAGTSINQIAEATGMAKSALYHHFASKEALFLAVLRGLVGRLAAELRESTRGDTWRQRIENGSRGLARFLSEQEVDIPALLRDLAQIGSFDFITWRNQFAPTVLAPLIEAIEDGQAAGEVGPVDPLWAAWALVVLVGMSTRPLVRSAEGEIGQQTVDFFLRGIAARESEPQPRALGQADSTMR